MVDPRAHGGADVALRLAERLADVARLEHGELGGVRLQQLAQPVQDPAAGEWIDSPQPGCAARATATARSISSAPPSASVASGRAVAGSMSSNVRPEADGTRSPPIRCPSPAIAGLAELITM